MPNYTYTCDAGHVVQIFHPMAGPVRSVCEDPSGCRAPSRIKIQLPRFQFSHSLKTDREYREDLARFPQDPRAFVDGPRATRKLLDQTKREIERTGGTIRSLGEKTGVEPLKDPTFREAYDETLNDFEENP